MERKKTPPVTTVREADKAKESKKVSTPPDGAAQSASSERNMSQHDFTVLNMGWRRQALSKTYDGNPLVDVRTGAGHADVRLGGL